MTREEIEARHAEIVVQHGKWTYDLPLTHGVWTRAFVALKRRPIALATSPVANQLQEPWPEGTLSYSATGRAKRLRLRLQRVLD